MCEKVSRGEGVGVRLNQEEFVSAFYLPLATVRYREQSRQQPDPVAQVLLTLIARTPDAIKEALERA